MVNSIIKCQRVYLASIIFSCVNNPIATCKVVEAPYLKCKLTMVNSTPSICTQTRKNCYNNNVCLAQHFTQTNRILHRHACDKFHVCLIPPNAGVPFLLFSLPGPSSRRKEKPQQLQQPVPQKLLPPPLYKVGWIAKSK